MKRKAVILEKKRLFDGFFKIDAARLQHELPDGSMSEEITRFVFERGDSTAALVHDVENQKIILTRQFRYPTLEKDTGWIEEIAAGSLKTGEDPLEGIRRELVEEIGYQMQQSEFIGKCYVSPGGTSERIFLYYATVSPKQKVSEGGGLDSEHEHIEILHVPVSEFVRKTLAAEYIDAKTWIAGLWFIANKYSLISRF
ncbi:MAG: NUDIX hydrolase [Flammeovirgaceae bacterium]|nr:NUDIX hydrolase [Flammeovirgaceae bacterium]MDW8287634.1 NUDIX hydrolase [Flammeovirgaceae bacterium]